MSTVDEFVPQVQALVQSVLRDPSVTLDQRIAALTSYTQLVDLNQDVKATEEWRSLQGKILDALSPYPEALEAVLAVIESREEYVSPEAMEAVLAIIDGDPMEEYNPPKFGPKTRAKDKLFSKRLENVSRSV